MNKLVLVCCFALALQACSIKQNVSQLTESSLSKMKEICIVENPAVRETFLPVYEVALKNKGVETKTLLPNATLKDCPFTSTYTARWSWDVTIYLAYAELNIYEDGSLAANAIYDSTSGSLNMDKFIKADKKVVELVDGMFGKNETVSN